MGDRMPASPVCDALRMALFNRRTPRGVIMPKGNCDDNAAMESWNHSLQVEAIHGERFATREQARVHVFEYIEVDYNRNRVHWRAGYLSPDQFEQANAAWAGVRKAGARSSRSQGAGRTWSLDMQRRLDSRDQQYMTLTQ